MDAVMGQVWRTAILAATGLSCAPLHPYTVQLSPGRYEVHCRHTLAECEPTARQTCADGYRVKGTKTGSSGVTVTIACEATPPPPAAVTRAPTSDPEDDLPKCAYDYQCTRADSRCVKGSCIIVHLLQPQ